MSETGQGEGAVPRGFSASCEHHQESAPPPADSTKPVDESPAEDAPIVPAQPPIDAALPGKKKGGWYLTLLSFVLIAGIAAVAVIYREELRDFEEYGYLGAFIINIMAGGTIIVPVPGVPVVFALGTVLTYPFLVGIAAGLGEGIGSFNFYMAGRGGQALVSDNYKRYRFYAKMDQWMSRRGYLTIFLASAIINPAFSVFSAMAGAMRMSPWKYYVVCAAGKAIKGTYIAYLGAWGLGSVLEWFGVSLG